MGLVVFKWDEQLQQPANPQRLEYAEHSVKGWSHGLKDAQHGFGSHPSGQRTQPILGRQQRSDVRIVNVNEKLATPLSRVGPSYGSKVRIRSVLQHAMAIDHIESGLAQRQPSQVGLQHQHVVAQSHFRSDRVDGRRQVDGDERLRQFGQNLRVASRTTATLDNRLGGKMTRAPACAPQNRVAIQGSPVVRVEIDARKLVPLEPKAPRIVFGRDEAWNTSSNRIGRRTLRARKVASTTRPSSRSLA